MIDSLNNIVSPQQYMTRFLNQAEGLGLRFKSQGSNRNSKSPEFKAEKSIESDLN